MSHHASSRTAGRVTRGQGSKAGRARKKSGKRFRWLKVTGLVTLLLGLVIFIAGNVFWWGELRQASAMMPMFREARSMNLRPPTEILSSDGTVLFTLAQEFRDPRRIDEIPDIVKKATIAAEDRRFFEHDGIDTRAIFRVLFFAAQDGEFSSGGASTIPMQIAYNVTQDRSRSFNRKVRDMALATMMERTFTKEEILEIYLNQAYYGAGAYGVAAAAEVFFDKSLEELTIGEAAMLARCVRRPSRENPFDNFDVAMRNRDVVLRIMLDEGMITQDEFQEAIEEVPELSTRPIRIASAGKRAPYFVDFILAQIRREFPQIDLFSGGYQIRTTLNFSLQQEAERAATRTIQNNRSNRVSTAAFLLTDRNGRILAMVGGGDYERNQFNVVTQGRRQPGSAFKPFVYAAGIEMGIITARSSISNERFNYQDPSTGQIWSPRNANNQYGGRVSVRTAMASSINIPAVRLLDQIGPNTMVGFAHRNLGFQSELPPFLPLALGAADVSIMELANAYSAFMLGGDRFNAYGIAEIIAPDGTVIFRGTPQIQRGALSSSTAEDVDALLRAVVTSGTGRTVSSVVNARGKTGTTNSNRDAWFAGYTDQFLGIGWVGHEVRNESGTGAPWMPAAMGRGVFGGSVVAPMWRDILLAAQRARGEESRQFAAIPGGTDTVIEDSTTVAPPAPSSPAPGFDPDFYSPIPWDEELPENPIPLEPPVMPDTSPPSPPPADPTGSGNGSSQASNETQSGTDQDD